MLFVFLACSGSDGGTESPADTGRPHETGLEKETGETGQQETGETGTDDSATPTQLPKLTLALDADVATIVHATWTDAGTDASLEYRFEGKGWLPAPAIEPGSGVVLGIPSETAVEVRVAETVAGVPVYSAVESIATGALPAAMILPDVSVYDPTLAYDADYAMISFSGGRGGWSPPWWIQILDRSGRVVWYHSVADDLMSFFPNVAHDGTHIWFDADDVFETGSGIPFVERRTLDGRWVVHREIATLGQPITEGPDGSWFYEDREGWSPGGPVALAHLDADGATQMIWTCTDEHHASDCWMNTINWNEEHGTVLASMFGPSTVFEVDVATGDVIRQMGALTSGDPYSFDPADSVFDLQHDPYWLDSGNLLVSTHDGTIGKQIAAEYSVDDKTKTLTRVWSYVSTDIWAEEVGEAVRLPNGNTLQGYGLNGAVREVTTDGEIAWEVSWVSPPMERTVGHLTFIPDLYALNVGGAQK